MLKSFCSLQTWIHFLGSSRISSSVSMSMDCSVCWLLRPRKTHCGIQKDLVTVGLLAVRLDYDSDIRVFQGMASTMSLLPFPLFFFSRRSGVGVLAARTQGSEFVASAYSHVRTSVSSGPRAVNLSSTDLSSMSATLKHRMT